MRAVERAAKAVLRPIYKAFVERPLWWFLSRVKAYFFAEVGSQLNDIGIQLRDISVQLREIEGRLQGWAAVEERLEANNAAQWDALEQLLLAMFRQPDGQRTEFAEMPEGPEHLRTARLDRVHAASNLR